MLGIMEKIREKAMKGRHVTGTLKKLMNKRNASVESKRDVRVSIILLSLIHASETLTRNSAQPSQILHGVEVSNIRRVRGLSRWNGECDVNENFDKDASIKGIKCKVKWVKLGTLRWCGHVERLSLLKVYVFEI